MAETSNGYSESSATDAYVSRGSSACGLRLPGASGGSAMCDRHLPKQPGQEFGMLPTSLAGVRPVAYVSLAATARVRHVAYISRGSSACGLRLPGGVGKSSACCLHVLREFGLCPTSPCLGLRKMSLEVLPVSGAVFKY